MGEISPTPTPWPADKIPPGPIPAESQQTPLSLTGPYQSTSLGDGQGYTRLTPSEDSPSREDDLGIRLGAYDLLEEIGRGGMGIIYKARHVSLGRLVALKTMRWDGDGSADRGQRFFREARAASQLTHPHIIPIYEVGDHQGRPYFTMTLITGGNLAQNRARLTDDIRQTVTLVEKVARAVQYAHDHGVLHRDIKPANILLDDQGEPHVGDFGLAKLRDGDLDLTQTGEVLGTPAYMSPEQARGKPDVVGPATDIWSLGILLYELLVGRRPFTADDTDRIKHNIREVDPPLPSTLRPGLDRSLERIILRCLEKEPEHRYPSAGKLADDLRNWLEGNPIEARSRLSMRTARRWCRRHTRMIAVVALLGMAVVAASVLLPLQDKDRKLHLLEDKLRRGEPVVLVDDAGALVWSKWLGPEGALLKEQRKKGEGLALGSSALFKGCFLELLPDPQKANFDLSAEIRHRGSKDPGGEVGVFIACSNRGADHCYLGVSFNDILASVVTAAGKEPLPNLIHLDLCLYKEKPREEFHKIHLAAYPFTFAGPKDPPWRKIVLHLDAKKVQLQWQEKVMGEVQMDSLLSQFESLIKEHQNLEESPLSFSPRGALGLALIDGEAEFRNVAVKPLKP